MQNKNLYLYSDLSELNLEQFILLDKGMVDIEKSRIKFIESQNLTNNKQIENYSTKTFDNFVIAYNNLFNAKKNLENANTEENVAKLQKAEEEFDATKNFGYRIEDGIKLLDNSAFESCNQYIQNHSKINNQVTNECKGLKIFMQDKKISKAFKNAFMKKKILTALLIKYPENLEEQIATKDIILIEDCIKLVLKQEFEKYAKSKQFFSDLADKIIGLDQNLEADQKIEVRKKILAKFAQTDIANKKFTIEDTSFTITFNDKTMLEITVSINDSPIEETIDSFNDFHQEMKNKIIVNELGYLESFIAKLYALAEFVMTKILKQETWKNARTNYLERKYQEHRNDPNYQSQTMTDLMKKLYQVGEALNKIRLN
jgi:hypothetical protein